MKKIIGISLATACVAIMAVFAGCAKDYFIDGPSRDAMPDAAEGIGGWDVPGEGGENGAPVYQSGVMTAAEWNDIANWTFWASLLNNQDWGKHAEYWKYHPHNFVMVETVDKDRNIVSGVDVSLVKGGTTVWKARTDNVGRALLWASMYESEWNIDKSGYTVKVSGGDYQDFEFTTPGSTEVKVNRFVVNTTKVENSIDVAFIVDATGSMGDEIGFLKADLEEIIKLVEQQCTSKVRTGTVFYRDEGDDYVTKFSQFTTNLKDTRKFIEKQSAGGGGDWPEAVHKALSEGLQSLSWNANAKGRIAFMVLDAPPHDDAQIISSCQKSIEAYAAQGIKIIPVACSGIDKACEYLLRSFAMATNGTYVFVTNDSGVGEEHIEATVGEYKVELLRDLIARLIIAYAK